ASVDHRLIVIAYDDRNITLDGKLVVGPTGGTWRASGRMIDRFSKELKFEQSTDGPFDLKQAVDGRLRFILHRNPENKILHTALVGEMNGLLHALTLDSALEGKWGTFGGPRAYSDFIQPAEKRDLGAAGGGGLS